MTMVFEIFNENEWINNCEYFRQQNPFSVTQTFYYLIPVSYYCPHVHWTVYVGLTCFNNPELELGVIVIKKLSRN